MSTSSSPLSFGPLPLLARRPRAILLDAGNTLVEIDYATIGAIAARFGIVASADRLRAAEWRARVRLDRLLGPSAAGAGYPPIQKSTEGADVFRRFMAMIFEEAELPAAADLPAPVLAAIQARHRAESLWSRPHPAARAVLAELKAAGFKLAVVSNAGGDVAALLARLDLAAPLDAILDSGIVGVEKPDPAIFHLAAVRLGVAAAECLHVGDLYSVDVVGARAAGAEPVLIDPAGLWPQEDCIKVHDLAALPRLVR
jgi:putative hydrolase of the HAD superfamily